MRLENVGVRLPFAGVDISHTQPLGGRTPHTWSETDQRERDEMRERERVRDDERREVKGIEREVTKGNRCSRYCSVLKINTSPFLIILFLLLDPH